MLGEFLLDLGGALFPEVFDVAYMCMDAADALQYKGDTFKLDKVCDFELVREGTMLPPGCVAVTVGGGFCIYTEIPLLFKSVIISLKPDVQLDIMDLCLNLCDMVDITNAQLSNTYNHMKDRGNSKGAYDTDREVLDVRSKLTKLKEVRVYDIDTTNLPDETKKHLQDGLSVQKVIEGTLTYLNLIMNGNIYAPYDSSKIEEVFIILASCKDYYLSKYIYDVAGVCEANIQSDVQQVVHLALKHITYKDGNYEIDVDSFYDVIMEEDNIFYDMFYV